MLFLYCMISKNYWKLTIIFQVYKKNYVVSVDFFSIFSVCSLRIIFCFYFSRHLSGFKITSKLMYLCRNNKQIIQFVFKSAVYICSVSLSLYLFFAKKRYIAYLECVTIEFRQGPIYVVNFQFSRCLGCLDKVSKVQPQLSSLNSYLPVLQAFK